MSYDYTPKYLKEYHPTTQEQQDAEVFAMVKGNPGRKVDANTLPPIAMDNDGNLFFTDPAPTKAELAMAACTVLAFLLAAVIAIVALAVPAADLRLLSIFTVAAASIMVFTNMKGEKNAQHKQKLHR